ncbi:MAG: hypothetical protein AB8G11_16745, partial [Saprospiraceae bacterium]
MSKTKYNTMLAITNIIMYSIARQKENPFMVIEAELKAEAVSMGILNSNNHFYRSYERIWSDNDTMEGLIEKCVKEFNVNEYDFNILMNIGHEKLDDVINSTDLTKQQFYKALFFDFDFEENDAEELKEAVEILSMYGSDEVIEILDEEEVYEVIDFDELLVFFKDLGFEDSFFGELYHKNISSDFEDMDIDQLENFLFWTVADGQSRLTDIESRDWKNATIIDFNGNESDAVYQYLQYTDGESSSDPMIQLASKEPHVFDNEA